MTFTGEKRAKNNSKWKTTIVRLSCASRTSIRNSLSRLSGTVYHMIWFLVHLCKMIISPGRYFFFNILMFWIFRGVKGQIIVQNDKKFCSSHPIFQWPYIIWFSFKVRIRKMIISPGLFFIFIQNFDLIDCYGGETAKNGPKWQKKKLSPTLNTSGTIHHMIILHDAHI